MHVSDEFLKSLVPSSWCVDRRVWDDCTEEPNKESASGEFVDF